MLVHPRFQKAVGLWKLQPEASAVWVRFSASAFGLDKDLFMASVYIPPGGSLFWQMERCMGKYASPNGFVLLRQRLPDGCSDSLDTTKGKRRRHT